MVSCIAKCKDLRGGGVNVTSYFDMKEESQRRNNYIH